MKSLLQILFLVTIFCGCQPKSSFPDGLFITNIDIIDAHQGLIKGMTVVIVENKIVKVGKAGEIKLVGTDVQIDGKGKYLIPGLWDAHVHFAYIEELAPLMFDLFLTYGITSVRDTGGKIEFVKKWKDLAEQNPSKAPRVKIAGPLLDGMPNVYDGSAPTRPPLSVGAGSVGQAVAIVDHLDSMEVDLIKAYEMLTPDQFVAIAERARSKGLKVTGHVPLSMDVISASNAGMNSMEHLRNLEMSCAKDAENLLQARRNMLADGKNEEGGVLRSNIHTAQRNHAVQNQDDEKTEKVLGTLARNNTWQIPTLALSTGFVRRPFLSESWQNDFKVLPELVRSTWIEGINNVKATEPSEAQLNYKEWALDMINKINKAGIGIMAGTDCPIFFLTPGRSLHEELLVLVEGGLTPLEAIESATLKPAEYFEMQDQLGLIKEGHFADLLILDKNPLEDINNTRSIHVVIKNGEIYDR